VDVRLIFVVILPSVIFVGRLLAATPMRLDWELCRSFCIERMSGADMAIFIQLRIGRSDSSHNGGGAWQRSIHLRGGR
jgi:hypothetical protein